MPAYDGTGPGGRGPYGRGLGPCGQGGRGTYRGFFGFGRRGGFGRGFWPFKWRSNIPIADEKSQLNAEKEFLSRQMEEINQRLNDIESNE